MSSSAPGICVGVGDTDGVGDAVAQFQNALGIVHVNGLLHDVQTLPGVGQTFSDTIFETSFVVVCAKTFLLGAMPH